MDDKYYLKYLKYRNKYLALKDDMIGGMDNKECEELLKKRNIKSLNVKIPIINFKDYNIFKEWTIEKLNSGDYKNDYPKLEKLKIDFTKKKISDNLNANIFPDSLQRLQIYNYNKELVQGVFPKSLKYLNLHISSDLKYTIPENVLPENLETLILIGNVNIKSVPQTIKNLYLNNQKTLEIYPKKIHFLCLESIINQDLFWLEDLTIDILYIKDVISTKSFTPIIILEDLKEIDIYKINHIYILGRGGNLYYNINRINKELKIYERQYDINKYITEYKNKIFTF